MNDLPRLTYFDDPVAAKCFERSDAPCLCCGRVRGWLYTGVIYGRRDDEPRVCPWCVADGSAARAWKDGIFNSIDENVPAEVREEVEKRTPGFATWQTLIWPVCCRDACVFRGYAQYAELTEKWPEAGKALLSTYQVGWLGPQTPEEFLGWFKNECDPGAYAFQCRHCGKFHVPWDIS